MSGTGTANLTVGQIFRNFGTRIPLCAELSQEQVSIEPPNSYIFVRLKSGNCLGKCNYSGCDYLEALELGISSMILDFVKHNKNLAKSKIFK